MMYEELTRVKHRREDGWLSELVSMNYPDQPFHCVHTYVVSIAPGKTRAKHYHRKKEEWAAITSGKIQLLMEHVETKEKASVLLDTASPDYKIIYIPPNVAHALRNPGECDASLVMFSRMPEDKDDTIPYEMSE
ncbi:MAG TPA: WxcM-like domain-containing protein [Methanocella sp.]|jgi:oxalate decarboxylase/phosphoglucose isomerase-like protein (cupin superfamily)